MSCLGPVSLALAVLLGLSALAGAQRPAGATSVPWARVLQQPDAWYGGDEARRVADNVLRYQHADGGWPKNVDMAMPPGPAPGPSSDPSGSTIDNSATTTQVRLLARVAHASGEVRYREGAGRGLGYLLAAQYQNGGWPQEYPVRTNYTRRITFNDNAMVNVMALLDEAAGGMALWGFVDAATRDRARAAVERGIAVTLRMQVRVAGRLTAWCAQHDEVTLEPRGARTYEHPSLSGMETVGIVRFLLQRATPDDARLAPAVEAAVAWLDAVKLTGVRLHEQPAPATPRGWDRVLMADPAAPPLWARFYEIGTNRPLYSGRDGVIRYRLDEIEYERRTGYSWVGDWPRTLVEREYPAWRARR